jgi:DNA-directed RNA polymerase subunit K/omega
MTKSTAASSSFTDAVQKGRTPVIYRPAETNAFEFAVVAGLRAVQLSRGCTPRVGGGSTKVTIIAQQEVAEGKVVREQSAAEFREA